MEAVRCARLAPVFYKLNRKSIKGSSMLVLKIVGAQDGAGAAGGSTRCLGNL